jgi:hypothetical protein
MKITLEMFKQAVKNGMKVLHLDCETTPMRVYTHYIGSKVSLNHGQIKTNSQVMCVQFKFEGEKKAKYLEWDKVGKAEFDDASLLDATAELIGQADIIVGQNLDAFDMKVLQGRMAILDLEPFNYDITLDILKLSRKSFRFASQRLDYRSKLYGNVGKNRMEFQDWIDVLEGIVPVSKKMAPYGCVDVDEAQFILHREFNHYRKLPKNIEKIILSFIAKPIKIECAYCATSKKGSKYDVTITSQTSKSIKAKCNRCDSKIERKL